MRGLSSVSSVGLALVGMLTAVEGVAAGEFKPFMIGLVLLAGAAVFALLYIGARRRTGTPAGWSEAAEAPHAVADNRP
jgi:hypothetical protein